jgi:hypothetical protein
MEEAIKILNQLRENSLLKDYAICEGVALVYYIEPLLTYDLDVMFIPSDKDKDRIDVLSNIYKYLTDRGYQESKEHIIIGDMPVQFIPASDKLTKEAVEKAREINYRGQNTKVILAEYLLAIMLNTLRPKDKERIVKFVDEYDFDRELLSKILNKFALNDIFSSLTGAHPDNNG